MTRKQFQTIFKATIPVMAGYIVLAMGFSIYAKASGYGLVWSLLMSVIVYAGSMQYVLVDLLASGAGILVTLLTTLMVNARHMFYGISMIEKYQGTGKKKPYLIFSLTDETYSLVCNDVPDGIDPGTYYFYVSLFDQLYWIIGTILGALASNIIPFSTDGIEFSMTALFIVVFLEQWLSNKNHVPALSGLLLSIICLYIFGSDNFLIPSMILITISLLAERNYNEKRLSEDE